MMAGARLIHEQLDIVLVDPSISENTLASIGRRIQLALEARGMDIRDHLQ